MRRLLLFAIATRMIAAPAPATYPGPASLANELGRLQAAIGNGRAAAIANTLPDSWEIETPGRRYSIATAPLRNLLASPEEAERWLAHLEAELGNNTAPLTSARNRLDRILARREFAGERPPSPLEMLWNRFTTWLKDVLRRLLGPVFGNPVTGRALFWLLALAAAAFLIAWLWRRFGLRSGQQETPQPALPVLRAGEWLRAAKRAADRGELRAAVHASYWAAVTYLQDARLLPEDATRTPREYLACVGRGQSIYPPLAALSAELERFWYADRPVAPHDVETALRNVEALGCRAD